MKTISHMIYNWKLYDQNCSKTFNVFCIFVLLVFLYPIKFYRSNKLAYDWKKFCIILKVVSCEMNQIEISKYEEETTNCMLLPFIFLLVIHVFAIFDKERCTWYITIISKSFQSIWTTGCSHTTFKQSDAF